MHDKGLYHILNVRNNAPNFQEVAGHFGSGLCFCVSVHRSLTLVQVVLFC